MMSSAEIERFKARLLHARDRILGSQGTRDSAAAVVELDQSSVGRLSRMDALSQQAMAQELRRRAALELKRIDVALRRCDDGSYGYCLDCDEPIDPRRLDHDPAAALCVRCAGAREN